METQERKALDYLIGLVRRGWEYAAAESQACEKFDVPSYRLAELYDKYGD
jgi:hypothetical protein